jgi:hypothetical protein
MTTARDNSWHLDKRVPITIVFMFVVQTVTLVYIGTSWKADIDSRVAALEKSENRMTSYEARIIVLEQGVLGIREDLSEIKELLRSNRQGRLIERPKLQP